MDVRNFGNSRFSYSYDYLPVTDISLYGFKFFSNSIIPLHIISGLPLCWSGVGGFLGRVYEK